MNCAAVKSRMEGFVSQTLPEGEHALVEQHLASCEGCKLEIELVRVCGASEKPTDSLRTDWGFDRIFGAEAGGGPETPMPAEASPETPMPAEASPETPTPPAATLVAVETPAPAEAPAPAATDSSAPTDDASWLVAETNAETAATSIAPNGIPAALDKPEVEWSFDAADARPSAAPPENSLFFAEEALSRDRDAGRKKGPNLRLLLWGAGGLVGACLLGLSAWMALNMGAPVQDRNDAALARRKAPVAREIPAPPLQPASSSEAQPTGSVSAPSDGAAAAPTPTPETSALQPPVPAPAPETTEEHSIDASIATMPAPLPTVRKTTPVAQAKPQGRAPKPAALSTAAPKPRTEPAATEPKPRPQQPTSEQLGPAPAIASSIPAPDESPSPQSTPQPAAPALELPTSAREAAPRQQSPQQSTLRPAAPAEVGGTEPTLPAPASEAQPVRPIDRLHMATAQAEAHDDLTTLRKLKNSWKTFTQKMGVGPDRSRAKREYADCIWAIQALTGRIQDQKDALQAYREFLLNAPAGGSDTRSISRLRQLEDALNERR